ncbi:MAG: hypothetical protein A2X22_07190 [Bacteroidetes bacterium GWF2_49_14]|nr:MAG: hypothetical protein A2X22_07190 [Bacteroidetes bacterium GWF2_49_14]
MKLIRLLTIFLLIPPAGIALDVYQVILPQKVNRTWISPEIWANPMQDWVLNNGKMTCVAGGGGRNLFLLTRELKDNGRSFRMSVMAGRPEADKGPVDPGWIGFILGVQGDFNDYRDDAVRGEGFPVGITTDGRMFIGNHIDSKAVIDPGKEVVRLTCEAVPEGQVYRIVLMVKDRKGHELGRVSSSVHSGWLVGGVALSCSHGIVREVTEIRGNVAYGNWGLKPGTERKGNVRFWFSEWLIDGEKFESHPERAFGPILFCQYSLSKKVLKLTAQMTPVGKTDGQVAILEISSAGLWKEIAEAPIDSASRTATFRVSGWEEKKDLQYRVRYSCRVSGKKSSEFRYTGTIRHEPWEKEEIVIAAFTGNNDLGFPNTDIVRSVGFHDPDLLFFSGDQIYEGVGGYGIQTEPLDKALLDYLRKWYLYGWAYGDLLKDRPSVAIPDDHDVYHGNLWGAGGIATPKGLSGAAAQDQGGYKMDPVWVNMVQRTQTSHLPDPADPAPAAQGIGVYFTELRYAGISFAILEDRKFKSAPGPLLPAAKVYNGFATNTAFNPAENGNAPGASLLGARQEAFLDQWTNDWTDKTWMKVVLSQTIFANVATLPVGESNSDAAVPKLRIMKTGEYPENDTVVQDMDSNGWPQGPRKRAVSLMRKGYAFHIAGDQHLGSVIQYGADNWRDGGYAFCVPAISNVWPRRWCPVEQGFARFELDPRYTGDYLDGFGNKMTVFAVSNPAFTGLEPSILYDRATGYGIVRLNRETRDITMECWPRISNPADTSSRQYPGWPKVINQMSNRNQYSNWVLPLIKVPEMKNSVIQVVSEQTGQVEFTMRIKGNAFMPQVDKPGKYTIWVGEPGSDRWIGIPGFAAIPSHITQEYVVRFN